MKGKYPRFEIFRRFVWVLFVIVEGVVSACGDGGSGAFCVPDDFSISDSAPGVTLYERGRQTGGIGGTDYVVAIDLSAGASLEFQRGPVLTPSLQNPLILRQSLKSAWQDLRATSDRAFCMSNGGFFDNGLFNQLTTTLAYPLKSDGELLSTGYPGGEDPACPGCRRMMLGLWNTRARIAAYDGSALCAGCTSCCPPDIIVGNSNDAARRASDPAGRTYVGTADRDGDGVDEIVLLLSASQATAAQATAILEQGFCASGSMMLDGGGSTQLICSVDPESPLIRSSDPIPRTIPQTIGVLTAGPQ